MSKRKSAEEEEDEQIPEAAKGQKRRKSFKAQLSCPEPRYRDYACKQFTRFCNVYAGRTDATYSVVNDQGCMFITGGRGYVGEWESQPIYKMTAYCTAAVKSEPDLCRRIMKGEASTSDKHAFKELFQGIVNTLDQARHLCPHGSKATRRCVLSSHLAQGSQKDNEVDKHFSYFLDHKDSVVRDTATSLFSVGGALGACFYAHFGYNVGEDRRDDLRAFINACLE